MAKLTGLKKLNLFFIPALALATFGCDRSAENPNNGNAPALSAQENAGTTSATTASSQTDTSRNQVAPIARDTRPMPSSKSPTGAGVDPTDSRDNAKDLSGYERGTVNGVIAQAGKDPTAPNAPQQTAVNPSAFQPARALDLNAYPYDRRSQLRSVLETRMTSLDKGIESLRSQINAKPSNGGASMQDRISDIEQKFDGADERLKGLETVRPENWTNYKRQLRDEIASLEEAYQRLQVATR